MEQLDLPFYITNSDYIPSFGLDFVCNILKEGGYLKCLNLQNNLELEIPNVLKEKITALYTGLFHICCETYKLNDISMYIVFECFGGNNFGQIDQPQISDDSMIEDMIVGITDITAGPFNTCYNFKYGKLICWGNELYKMNDIPDEFTQMIDPEYEFRDLNFYDISISSHFICAIKYNSHSKELKCWGYLNFGIGEFDEIKRKYGHGLTSGIGHVCIIISLLYIHHINESVECWGNNLHSQLNIPREMKMNVEKLQAGNYFTCGMKTNFYMLCWGYTDQVPFGIKTVDRLVSAGGRHTCVHEGGILDCVGNNEYGQLEVPKDHKYNSYIIEAGWDYTCSSVMGVTTNLNVSCWGLNNNGQLDIVDTLRNKRVYQVSTGLAYTCAIAGFHRNVHCWGDLHLGVDIHEHNLEDDVRLVEYRNVYINNDGSQNGIYETNSNISELSVGDNHVCYFISNGYNSSRSNYSTYTSCWGSNELGQNDIPSHLSSVKLSSITSGGAHTCVIEESTFTINNRHINNNELYCWGSNSNGQSSVPPESVRSGVRAVSAGAAHTCAAVEITIVCWGAYWEEYGFSSNAKMARVLSSGFEHDCWIEDNGYAKCAGGNEYGQGDLGVYEV